MKIILATFVVALLCIFTLSTDSNAQFSHLYLNNVASSFAEREVTIVCRNEKEDGVLYFAWGYVLYSGGKQDYSVLDEKLCLGALAIDLDVPEIYEFYKALGAVVLVHESFHLKKVNFNNDEAWTECRAMKNFDKVLRRLGAEEGTIARILPEMIILHWILITRDIRYNLPGCLYPDRYAKYGITNP